MTPEQIKAAIALAVVAGALAIGFGGAWVVQDWRYTAQIATAEKSLAVRDLKTTNDALTTLKTDAEAVHKAAGELGEIKLDLAPKFAALSREIKNATPLPVGCKPDAVRVRNLDAAIDAANESITRAGSRGAVPANK